MAAGRSLPVATSPLVGRSEQLAALQDLVRGPARLITVTGPPGVGKTRVALQLATTIASSFADGACWADLSPIQDGRRVAAELADALGAARGSDAVPLESVLAGWADRDVLLLVDNCEHLPDAAPAIAAVLSAMPRARVLATSRQRLNLLAEVEYPLPPLPLPAPADVEDLAGLARNASVELLLARAPAHVTLSRRTAQALAEVCLRLDGPPLALELAAARLRVFTPSELAFRLEHRTVALSGAPRDAPPRHRTLVSAIEWSHELLPDVERTVFRRLGVLVGGWTLAAAQAVCGLPEAVVVAAVEVLLEQSLVQHVVTDGTARFAMLASIRAFAADQLAASDELTATRDRHATHFAHVGAGWEASLGTDAEGASWAEFVAVYPDLSAAFDHVGPGRAQAQLAVALAWYGHVHGYLVQAPAALTALREVAALPAAPAGAALDAETRTAMSIAAGVIGLGLGDPAGAGQDLRAALRQSEARGDDRRTAVALSFLGHVARSLGRYADAAEYYRSAREVSRRRGNVRGTAWAAFDLGLLMVDVDDPDERAAAEPLLREALTYFTDLDYGWALAQSARALAVALLDRDAVDEAAALLGRSLVLHDRFGDQRGCAQCLEGLAQVAAARGLGAGAARLIGAAQSLRRLGATTPTDGESRRLAVVETALQAELGPVAADHARHAGGTAGRSAVLAFAAGIAAPPVAAAEIVLTPRQTEVAALVAAGRTNRQIGRALGISEKTAEVHVSNIMTRLNVPSRAGVAAWVSTHPLPAPP